ncbi:unnamed protein product, partial [Discosporangium mesarthrocarpum]
FKAFGKTQFVISHSDLLVSPSWRLSSVSSSGETADGKPRSQGRGGRARHQVSGRRGGRSHRDSIREQQKKLVQSIKQLGRSKDWKGAMRELRQAQELGRPINAWIIAAAVGVLGGCGRWREAVDLVEETLVSGPEPDTVVYNTALNACAQSRQWREAELLFHRMREHGMSPPDIVSHNTLINVYSKGGQWQKAVALVEEMWGADDDSSFLAVKPDAYSVNGAIDACARAGRWREAMGLLQRMSKDDGTAPDGFSFSSTISACTKAREWEHIWKLWLRMREEGLRPGRGAFGQIVSARIRQGHGLEALTLLRQVDAEGVGTSTPQKSPALRLVDLRTHEAAAAACADVGDWQTALAVLEAASEMGQPTVPCFNAVMAACKKGGQVDQALDVFERLKRTTTGGKSLNSIQGVTGPIN